MVHCLRTQFLRNRWIEIYNVKAYERCTLLVTGLRVWQSRSESGWDLFVLFIFILFIYFFFFRVGKSLVCHSPAKWYLCA